MRRLPRLSKRAWKASTVGLQVSGNGVWARHAGSPLVLKLAFMRRPVSTTTAANRA